MSTAPQKLADAQDTETKKGPASMLAGADQLLPS
jgi:hypothetical protein